MKRRKRKRSAHALQHHDEGSYTCPSCGELIVIPLDPTTGEVQEYVEDCPVCCNPIVIHVELFEAEGNPDDASASSRVWAESE